MTRDEAIKQYLDWGWTVLPVVKGEKRPAVSWKEYQNRKPTEAELKEWFADLNVGVGLITGKCSGVIVVDEDTYKTNSKKLKIETPLKSKTGGGGVHYFFKYREGVQNSVNSDIAIDKRADRGFVVLPPTIHPSGKPYEWVSQLPETLGNLPEYDSDLDNQLTKNNTTGESLKVSDYLNVNEGSRDDSLLRLANSLLNKHSEEEAWQLVEAANNNYNPPLSLKDVERIFNQARNFIKNNPATNRKNTPVTENPDWKPTTHEEDIEKVKIIFREGITKGIPSGFPSLDELIGGFIPGQTYLFFADTNVGKSALVLNILVHLAQSGQKTTYFDLENPYQLTAERLVLINEDNLTIKDWNQLVRNKQFDMYLDNLKKLPLYVWDLTKLNDRFGDITFSGVTTCIKEAIGRGEKVFAIDHLHYFQPGEQNYDKLQDIARQLNDLAAENNVVILLVAHTKKGLINADKTGTLTIRRPIIEDINGSSLISKHTKNLIGVLRNYQAPNLDDKCKTILFIDKTKSGLGGKVELKFNPNNLHFEDSRQYPEPIQESLDILTGLEGIIP